MDDERNGGGMRMAAVTTLGLGYLRPASGTWGSLPPIAVAGGLIVAGVGGPALTAAMALGAVVFTGFCVAFGDEAEARYRKKDPGQVVADETAGQCVALLFFPVAHPRAWWLLAAAFLLFRLFDIIKPPPARQAQSLAGGPGIVVDDLIAGAMALVCVQLLAAVL